MDGWIIHAWIYKEGSKNDAKNYSTMCVVLQSTKRVEKALRKRKPIQRWSCPIFFPEKNQQPRSGTGDGRRNQEGGKTSGDSGHVERLWKSRQTDSLIKSTISLNKIVRERWQSSSNWSRHKNENITETELEYKTGVIQSSPTSHIFFKFYIDDLAKRVKLAAISLCKLVIKPKQLVANDLILLTNGEIAMEFILQICAEWVDINKLEWSTP